MPIIPNRSAFVLVPDEAMLQWVQKVHDPEADMETLFGESEVYLVPAFVEDEEMDAVLFKLWPKLFENELGAWSRDRGSWPPQRTFAMFQEWFKVTPFNGVVDLGVEPMVFDPD